MLIPKNIFPITSTSSKDSFRLNLNSVYLERKKGKPYATATNGHSLIQATWEELPEAEYPLVDGKQLPTTKEDFKALVPRDAFDALGKSIPKKGVTHIPVLNTVAVNEIEANGKMQAGTYDLESARVQSVSLIQQAFPDIEQVMPTKAPVFTVGIDGNLLANVLTAMGKIVDQKHPCIKFEFTEARDAVKLTAQNGEGIEVTAIVMPMRI